MKVIFDIPEEIQKGLDIMIVSMHEPLMEGGNSADKNTSAILKVMDNPYGNYFRTYR